MKEHFVIDPLISKRQQLMLATQLCRMVLKVRYLTPQFLLIISHMYLSLLILILQSHPIPVISPHTRSPSHPLLPCFPAQGCPLPRSSAQALPVSRYTKKTQTRRVLRVDHEPHVWERGWMYKSTLVAPCLTLHSFIDASAHLRCR
jgi:hypothetical protein